MKCKCGNNMTRKHIVETVNPRREYVEWLCSCGQKNRIWLIKEKIGDDNG